MIMRRIGLTLIFFLSVLFIHSAFSETLSRNLPKNLPVKVKIGFSIDDVIDINEKKETITFDGILSLQWKDPRLAFTPTREYDPEKHYTDDNATKKINSIWHPHIILVNLRGSPDMYASFLTIKPSGVVTYVKRFIATIENQMDFTKFPFERQEKIFSFQSLNYNANQVQLVRMPEREGFFHPDHLEEWELIRSHINVKNVVNPLFNEKFSRYTLALDYQRQAEYYFFQTLLPLFLIVSFSFCIFWMMEDPIVNRAAITLTAILTIVVFEWQIFRILPHIAYLTFLDVLILFSFLVVVLTLFPSIGYNFTKKENRPILVKLCRWGFPILYILGILIIVLIYFL